jgi:aryl-alcohol dehydrogenase-like predicted oxidoreductase
VTQLHFPVSRKPGELLWGSQDSDGLGYVNQYGQSRKHIFDSVQQSLKRLQLDYIDVLQCSLPFPFYSLALHGWEPTFLGFSDATFLFFSPRRPSF